MRDRKRKKPKNMTTAELYKKKNSMLLYNIGLFLFLGILTFILLYDGVRSGSVPNILAFAVLILLFGLLYNNRELKKIREELQRRRNIKKRRKRKVS